MHADRRYRITSLLPRLPRSFSTLPSTRPSGSPKPRCFCGSRAIADRPIVAFLLLLTSTLGVQTSLAQQTQTEDAIEETVVVASRAPDLIDQVGVSVSVLNLSLIHI